MEARNEQRLSQTREAATSLPLLRNPFGIVHHLIASERWTGRPDFTHYLTNAATMT
jgi:hypothetical protein